jgi:hypothetical protein
MAKRLDERPYHIVRRRSKSLKICKLDCGMSDRQGVSNSVNGYPLIDNGLLLLPLPSGGSALHVTQ